MLTRSQHQGLLAVRKNPWAQSPWGRNTVELKAETKILYNTVAPQCGLAANPSYCPFEIHMYCGLRGRQNRSSDPYQSIVDTNHSPYRLSTHGPHLLGDRGCASWYACRKRKEFRRNTRTEEQEEKTERDRKKWEMKTTRRTHAPKTHCHYTQHCTNNKNVDTGSEEGTVGEAVLVWLRTQVRQSTRRGQKRPVRRSTAAKKRARVRNTDRHQHTRHCAALRCAPCHVMSCHVVSCNAISCHGHGHAHGIKMYQNASKMYRKSIKMYQNISKCIKKHQKCIKNVSNMYQKCIKNVSKMYQKLYKKCTRNVLKMYQFFFKKKTKNVKKKLQKFWKNVIKKFVFFLKKKVSKKCQKQMSKNKIK